jgi:hypothetical protein
MLARSKTGAQATASVRPAVENGARLRYVSRALPRQGTGSMKISPRVNASQTKVARAEALAMLEETIKICRRKA